MFINGEICSVHIWEGKELIYSWEKEMSEYGKWITDIPVDWWRRR